ncbi:MAG TPA: FecR domain-containing protein [Niabella sp.]
MNDRQIRNYFQNKCSDEEAAQVIEYLRSNPELLDKYMTEYSWQHFQPTERWLRGKTIWLNILETIKPAQVKRRKRFFWAAAAVCCFIIGSALFFIYQRPGNTAPGKPGNIARTAPANHIIRNDGKQNMRFTLPDSSLVTLCPNSSLSFPEVFNTGKRDVLLKGTAMFSVYKDKKRPFSVFAGQTVTTALGTVFWVHQKAGSTEVKVRLLEGKVVIRKVTKDTIGRTLAVLTPGTEYVTASSAGAYEKQKRSIPVQRMIHPITFDKVALGTVLDSIQYMMQVRIDYPKNKFTTIYTGAFDPSKVSVESFLKELCLLNGWTMKQLNNNQYKMELSKKD